MEPFGQKSLEKVVSQRALQMGSSFPCQICVVGFLCGVCLTSLFLAALTSIGTFEFSGISFSAISLGNSLPRNSSHETISELNLFLSSLFILFSTIFFVLISHLFLIQFDFLLQKTFFFFSPEVD